jgi:hypothetical protein
MEDYNITKAVTKSESSKHTAYHVLLILGTCALLLIQPLLLSVLASHPLIFSSVKIVVEYLKMTM